MLKNIAENYDEIMLVGCSIWSHILIAAIDYSHLYPYLSSAVAFAVSFPR